MIYQRLVIDPQTLQNGIVNLINGLHTDRYRHAIVCLTDYTDFRMRLQRDVPIVALHKRDRNDPLLFLRLWSLLRKHRPAIVHTRNLATLEAQLPAFLAGVKCRVHGEHGRDVHDVDGTSRKYRLLRRMFRPLVHQYVAVSQELETYLSEAIRVPGEKLSHICNGVDTESFYPRAGPRPQLNKAGFVQADSVVIGTVGRLESIKDQMTLARAFIELLERVPERRQRLRLVMIGEGTLRHQMQTLLEQAGCADIAWLPGEREDIPELMRYLDIFVLPSLAEGISNTILEAMASGLPVVATQVGGNSELVVEGESGFLVPRGDPTSMAGAIERYLEDPQLVSRHGWQARKRTEENFSINEMVHRYTDLYDRLLKTKGCLDPLTASSAARSPAP